MRLGLTGGIGSGKSTVAQFLTEFGATIIDADAVSRHTTAAGGAAIAPIRAAFGEAFIAADGSMNRDKIRSLVFSDAQAKQQLESIIHPLVAEQTTLLAARAERQQCPLIVFDIPLLVESAHWRNALRHIVVVDCEPDTQVKRVIARSNWSREMAVKVITAQAARIERLAAADTVIFNDSIELPQLRALTADMARRFGL